MCIAANAGHALKSEIEELRLETGFLEEGDKERSQAAVDVEGNLALDSEFGEGGDVVDNAVGEVGRGSDKQDGIAVD